jgi:Phosphopantetheinyl transferase (holo-ACP synthase)
LKLKDIEMINNPDGSPEIFLNEKNKKEILVSISHEKNYAIAFVTILKNLV